MQSQSCLQRTNAARCRWLYVHRSMRNAYLRCLLVQTTTTTTVAVLFWVTYIFLYQQSTAVVSRRVLPPLQSKKVVILAYFRSGSTVFSQIFNANPFATFWFEPLRGATVELDLSKSGIPSERHYNTSLYNSIRTSHLLWQKSLLQPLTDILHCNYESLDHAILLSPHMTHGATTKIFRICAVNAQNGHVKSSSGHFRCRQLAVDSCRHSQIVAVKVIRLHMSVVDQLLVSDPSMHIIHLVRDPRAILNSWWRGSADLLDYKRELPASLNDGSVNGSKPTSAAHAVAISATVVPDNWKSDVKALCGKLLDDVTIGDSLVLKYPDRIRRIRYEDFVANSVAVTKSVYGWLLAGGGGNRRQATQNVDVVPRDVVDALRSMINAPVYDDPYGTKRPNSSQTARRWRLTLNSKTSESITDICQRVLRRLNYT